MENSDHFGDTVLSSKASDMREDFLMLNAITATGRGKINKELNIEIRPARTVARLVLCCNLDADIWPESRGANSVVYAYKNHSQASESINLKSFEKY